MKTPTTEFLSAANRLYDAVARRDCPGIQIAARGVVAATTPPDAAPATSAAARLASASVRHIAKMLVVAPDADAAGIFYRDDLARGLAELELLSAAAPVPDPFVPTVFQQQILDALDGTALMVEKMAVAIRVEPSRFYKPGGIHELKARGLVTHKHGVGYYRPDAPPPPPITARNDREKLSKRLP